MELTLERSLTSCSILAMTFAWLYSQESHIKILQFKLASLILFVMTQLSFANRTSKIIFYFVVLFGRFSNAAKTYA